MNQGTEILKKNQRPKPERALHRRHENEKEMENLPSFLQGEPVLKLRHRNHDRLQKTMNFRRKHQLFDSSLLPPVELAIGLSETSEPSETDCRSNALK